MNDEQKQVFEKLNRSFPKLVEGKKIIGMGKFGVVLADIVPPEVPTVTKIFFHRQLGAKYMERARTLASNELLALDMMRGAFEFDDVKLPRLVSKTKRMHHPDYLMSVEMTKVPGVAGSWSYETQEEGLPANPEAYFRSAGQLMARFQGTARARALGCPHLMDLGWGGKIEDVPGLSKEIRVKLRDANEYLRRHVIRSVVHGDFRGTNVMSDESGKITGLVDFSHVSFSENALTDFVRIPRIMLPHAIQGYEEATQRKVEPVMIVLTHMTEVAAALNQRWFQDEEHEAAFYVLRGHLQELEKDYPEFGKR